MKDKKEEEKMNILLFWQFPQIILGNILRCVYKCSAYRKIEKPSVVVYSSKTMPSGISCGTIVILKETMLFDIDINHEIGHSIQSKYLGVFYLFIVGLPSFVMNLMSIYSAYFGSGKFYNNYYKRWPESWADKLGGVKRNE